jgi:hypothetical protein
MLEILFFWKEITKYSNGVKIWSFAYPITLKNEHGHKQ